MNFVEVYRAFHYLCLKLCSNHDHFGRFQRFCTTLCDLRVFQNRSKLAEFGIFVEKGQFKPPLWILWRCTVDFITFLSNYVWFITNLFNLRYFAWLCVASGVFKNRSKLAKLCHFWWKRSILGLPLWILWRCPELFITFVSNYAQIMTILVDFRDFAQLCVTSGSFKIAPN